MDKTLFNFHDFTLLLIAFECAVAAIYIGFNKPLKRQNSLLLVAFFVIHTFIALHELILWGHTFRYWVLDFSPNIFFLLNSFYVLDTPLLYLFICSLVNPVFRLKPVHALHLIPALIMAGFLYTHFYSLSIDERIIQVRTYSFADLNYTAMDFAMKLYRLIFVGLAIRLILHSFPALHRIHAPEWLGKAASAFAVVLVWELMLSGIKLYHALFTLPNYDIVEIVGLTDYYLLFLLLNLILFWSASSLIKKEQPKPVDKEPVNLSYVEKLERSMAVEKLYLNQNLSFERLAENLDIPVKDLSHTINRHYNVNFYEYLNGYRIQEARRLLEDPTQSHRSITDIFYDAGFNSKSVYNTLFKKKFSLTPSQYRKQFASRQLHSDAVS
ncbi:helix-turn-helix transcriptional regulator [Alteromonas pelagimontana]|uniref:Helix-turn-helix transcriptional regulator n=1 Tax=Alteromonas pelagimontana TaxID=1858656 RepID=A0A6M4MES1_9ALTE|nr:helix-turn-helix domain-containing protein [Alteromonas pelagimontana]QJR81368.1 helix-turn-helix transcriptional regulator [Alteromonas pelagimontana]